jgi:hypothetical protein
MVGFITERNLQQADEEFPGIARFFASLSPQPRTFLDLLLAFQRRADACGKKTRARVTIRTGSPKRGFFPRGDSCASVPVPSKAA